MGRSSQTSQSSTRQRRLPGKVISAMSPIGKIALMVVMMAIVEQSTSTISFARLGAQKDNLISAVGGIKRELLSPVAGIARGIFDAKKSIVRPIIGAGGRARRQCAVDACEAGLAEARPVVAVPVSGAL